MTLDRNPDKYW